MKLSHVLGVFSAQSFPEGPASGTPKKEYGYRLFIGKFTHSTVLTGNRVIHQTTSCSKSYKKVMWFTVSSKFPHASLFSATLKPIKTKPLFFYFALMVRLTQLSMGTEKT